MISDGDMGDQLARIIVSNSGTHPNEPKYGRYNVAAYVEDMPPLLWCIGSYPKSEGWPALVRVVLADLKRKCGDKISCPANLI